MHELPLQHAQASPAADDVVAGQAAFFSLASENDGRAIQESLSRARVAILGHGYVAAHTRAALAGAGLLELRALDESVSAAADLQSLDFILACLDAPQPSLLERLNRAALDAHVPWIVGQIDSGVGRMGPTMIPEQGPCYRCYDARRVANLDRGTAVAAPPSTAVQGAYVAPFPFAPIMGGFLALEAVRFLSGLAAPQTIGRVTLLDFHAREITYHRILRLPNCPACGFGKRRRVAGEGG